MSNRVDKWGYSSDAIDVLHRFHNARFVVYVEGQDDVPFWSSQFEKSGISEYHIEYAGGTNELRKIILQILQDDAQVVVACDSHYALLLYDLPPHDRIIASFGHSIENTMYCPRIINRVIQKLSNELNDNTSSIVHWYKAFCASAKLLLVYDLAREKYRKPVKVCGDNCARFLKARRSHSLDDTKIRDYIAEITPHFRPDETKATARLIARSSSEIRHLLNGHFLTNAIINLVKAYVSSAIGKRPVIPTANLYALTSDGCLACAHECDEFATHRDRIMKAVGSLALIS